MSAARPRPAAVSGVARRFRGRLVAGLRRRVGRPLLRRTPRSALRSVHAVRRRLRPVRYTDADPIGLLWVDPGAIHTSILETAPQLPQLGVVEGGEWDRAGEPFADRPIPRAIVDRFERGLPWAETPLRDHFASQLARFGNAWGHTSMAGFEARCAAIDELHASIRRHGYLSQAALGAADVNAPSLPIFDEINVDIGRDGALLWRAYGQHRLAIAQLLDVEAVPVLVQRRHRAWQSVRDARRGAPTGGSHVDHPDLVDLDG